MGKRNLTPEDFKAPKALKTKGGEHRHDSHGAQRTTVNRKSVHFEPYTKERRHTPKFALQTRRKRLESRLNALPKAHQSLSTCDIEEIMKDVLEVLLIERCEKPRKSPKRSKVDPILGFARTVLKDWQSKIQKTSETLQIFYEFAANGRVEGATFGDYEAYVESLRSRATTDIPSQEGAAESAATESLGQAWDATPVNPQPQQCSVDILASGSQIPFENPTSIPDDFFRYPSSYTQLPTLDALATTPDDIFGYPSPYVQPPAVEASYSQIFNPTQYTQYTQNAGNIYEAPYQYAQAVPFDEHAFVYPAFAGYGVPDVGMLPVTSTGGTMGRREDDESQWHGANPKMKRRREEPRSDHQCDQVLVCMLRGDTEGNLRQQQVVQGSPYGYFPEPLNQITGASSQAGASILPEAGNSFWGTQIPEGSLYGQQGLALELGRADHTSPYNFYSPEVDTFNDFQVVDQFSTAGWEYPQIYHAGIPYPQWSNGEQW